MHKAKERLYFTAARDALVRGSDDRAATLYAAIGDEIPDSASEQFGLVDGALPGFVEDSDTPVIDAAAAAIVAAGDATAAAAKTQKPAKPKAAKPAKAAAAKEAPAAPNKEQSPGEDKGAGAPPADPPAAPAATEVQGA